MSIIKEEYRDLPPKGHKLCDVVVLAQAWKKSHTYIRRHNWYADVLELDASTIELEDHLVRWSTEVRQADFQPKRLLLVPAPKNARWWFCPTPNITSLEQLLHLDVNDFGSEPSFEDWTPCEPEDAEPTVPVPVPAAVPAADAEPGAPIQKLRPLAHLSIRDQTLATAVMMCLAEAVESAQGDTTGNDVLEMRSRGPCPHVAEPCR